MTLLQDVVRELLGMFWTDARLTGAILALVLLVGGVIQGLDMEPLIGGGTLLVGCLVILLEATVRETRRRRRL